MIPIPPDANALVAVDPGRHQGFAVFVREPEWGFVLRACGLVRGTATAGDVSGLAKELREGTRNAVIRALWGCGFHPGQSPIAVTELMVWRPEDSRSNPEDLIQVSTVAAATVGALSSDPRFLRPEQWKATVPQNILENRIHRVLVPRESAVWNDAQKGFPGSLAHNVLDAVGIGLFATGRMGRGGTK